MVGVLSNQKLSFESDLTHQETIESKIKGFNNHRIKFPTQRSSEKIWGRAFNLSNAKDL